MFLRKAARLFFAERSEGAPHATTWGYATVRSSDCCAAYFPFLPVDEIVHLDPLRVALRTPLSTAVAKLPDQFLFLCVHRHYRLPQALKRTHPPVDVFELLVAFRMLLAFQRLAVGLQDVAQLV